jgi:hypothetical protein
VTPTVTITPTVTAPVTVTPTITPTVTPTPTQTILVNLTNNSLQAFAPDTNEVSILLRYGSDGQLSTGEGDSRALILYDTVPNEWWSGIIGAGVGADYQVFGTLVSGTIVALSSTTGTFDTWLPLSTTQNFSWNRTTVGTSTFSYRFDIRDVATGTVRGTHIIDFDIEVFGA